MQIPLVRDAGREGRPVYRQIADEIRRQIEAEQLADGSRLPPIRALAKKLCVNRDTVALAYEELAAAGLVESSVGRGTFVRAAASLSPAPADSFRPTLSPLADRLLEFERARPRYGSAAEAVPLHHLVPDPALYPVDEFRRVLNRVLARNGADLLTYGGPQGYHRLREVLAGWLGRASIEVEADDLVLCHGASQGLSLVLRLLANAGDAVALEEPTYNNALAAAAGLGLRTVPVPMRENGLDLLALGRVLERPEVKLLYTMPTFHNPLGTTSSLAHRRELLDVAARCGKPVIEDGFEMDLRFEGRPVPPLTALDRSGLVIGLFSFSKSLFPGVRVGAVAARGRVVEGLVALKQATDHSDAMPLQAALAEFVADGGYERHLTRMRSVLRGRRDAVLDALARELPEGTCWTTPEGGYQVWVELPEGLDTSDLLADAVGAGVLFAPGAQFNHDGRSSRSLRLSFATADEAALRRGVAILAGVVRNRLSTAQRPMASVHI